MAASYVPSCVLVTGGAGFIASNVVLRLVKKYPNYKIINLDKLDYCSSLKCLEEIQHEPNYKFIKGNILSADLIRYIIATENIDTIMHFAAQSHVDNSFGNSFQFTENNVLGTHVLLEAAKVSGGIKRFIHVSTDEVYGESTEREDGMTEQTILEPTNPYAATKAAAEFIVKAYYRSFQLPIIITRSNNVFGPRQFPEKIIPKFINLLMQDKKCPIHGNGEHMRNYLYVDDVVDAFDLLLHEGSIGETYNIAGINEKSNMEVARSLLRCFGLENKEEEYIELVEDRPFNDFRYAIDGSKLRQLGWSVKTYWEEGLAKTVEWYRSNPGMWDGVESSLVPHPRRISPEETIFYK